MLAAAFGRHDVYGWCNDTGLLCLWRVASKLSRATESPGSDGEAKGGTRQEEGDVGKAGKNKTEKDEDGASAATAKVILDTVTPDMIMETSTYLMSVAFHPERPSLVAGGTFGGELLVWNINLLETGSGGESAEECRSFNVMGCLRRRSCSTRLRTCHH